MRRRNEWEVSKTHHTQPWEGLKKINKWSFSCFVCRLVLLFLNHYAAKIFHWVVEVSSSSYVKRGHGLRWLRVNVRCVALRSTATQRTRCELILRLLFCDSWRRVLLTSCDTSLTRNFVFSQRRLLLFRG